MRAELRPTSRKTRDQVTGGLKLATARAGGAGCRYRLFELGGLFFSGGKRTRGPTCSTYGPSSTPGRWPARAQRPTTASSQRGRFSIAARARTRSRRSPRGARHATGSRATGRMRRARCRDERTPDSIVSRCGVMLEPRTARSARSRSRSARPAMAECPASWSRRFRRGTTRADRAEGVWANERTLGGCGPRETPTEAGELTGQRAGAVPGFSSAGCGPRSGFYRPARVRVSRTAPGAMAMVHAETAVLRDQCARGEQTVPAGRTSRNGAPPLGAAWHPTSPMTTCGCRMRPALRARARRHRALLDENVRGPRRRAVKQDEGQLNDRTAPPGSDESCVGS